MKKYFFIVTISFLTVSAYGYGYVQKNYGYNQNDFNNSGYESSSRTRYEYDLGKSMDRLKYSTDISAQMRDKNNLSPSIWRDRMKGQYGGGAL